MKIGLTYDIKQQAEQLQGLTDDAFEEYDAPETVEALEKAISFAGHDVVRLGGGAEFLTLVQKEKPDLVFNISEGLRNYRSREAQVPSVLEMLDIPYTGSDPLTLAVCLEKALTKQLVATAGVDTPQWCVMNTIAELEKYDWLNFPFPAFVKPLHEGSSKGIRNASRVNSIQALKELVRSQINLYCQPMMVEQYIAGDEITVGLIGNAPPVVLGIMRVIPLNDSPDFVYSLEVKRNWRELVRYECPAKLAPSVLRRIEENSVSVFQTLGIRDFARIDYRVDGEGRPYFLEVNPLPGLNPKSGDIVLLSQALGWSYEQLINTIINMAGGRYSFVS
ncbi:MAG: D-alanine--D-alanine ligase [Dehalococcoidia bacterium]|nr:D-alanine--D-alanine ligase [Dehalococcoidia bacterium]